MSRDTGSYEIATAALGLLTATYHDGDHFGPVSMEYLSAVGDDTGKVVRTATGMTALARLLLLMRANETGASPDDTSAESGRRLGDALHGSG